MSDASIMVGYIEEALPRYQEDRSFFRRANDAVLASLPEDDAYPPLCRSLFSATGDDTAHGSFRGRRLIHFAGHFNYFGEDLNAWLDKFEALLRRLYWLDAEVLLLQTWSARPVWIRYSVTAESIEGYTSADPLPPTSWKVGVSPLDSVAAKESDLFAWSILSERLTKSGDSASD